MMTTVVPKSNLHRRAAPLSLRYAAIVAAALVLVWMMRFKSVVCPASVSVCSADARLGPALAGTAVLLIALVVALTLTAVVPASRSTVTSRAITVGLINAGAVASIVVLVSAGFTLWPIWA